MYTLVMSNSVLSIAMLMVSSSRWGSFFDVVDSGLRVKLTELWINTVSLLLGQGVVLGCSSGCWDLLDCAVSLELLNGRHFDVGRLEDDA